MPSATTSSRASFRACGAAVGRTRSAPRSSTSSVSWLRIASSAFAGLRWLPACRSRLSVYRSGTTCPLTSGSPRPHTASMTISLQLPLTGLVVNITPASRASTISWTSTDMPCSGCPGARAAIQLFHTVRTARSKSPGATPSTVA